MCFFMLCGSQNIHIIINLCLLLDLECPHCRRIAVTPCLFYRNFFYTADFVVVSAAIALEIALMSKPELQDIIALIMLIRVWRIVRIGHGLYTTTHEAEHKHAGELESQVKVL